ncbi:MAG: pilus assembly protein [Burkholderiaceae bacterium]|nr:pilus assembly protein [Burkholderiaceae bacterium]
MLTAVAGLPDFSLNTGGYYEAPAANLPQWFDTINWTNDLAVRVLATPLAGVARQPRCIIERVDDIQIRPEGGELQPMETLTVYRLTAVGYGANANTFAQVQSTYVRP